LRQNLILRVERDRLRLDSHYGSLSSVKVGEDFPIRPDWVSGQAVSEGKVAHIFDMVAQRSSDFDSAANQGDVRYRATLIAPMLRDAEAIGAIAIRRAEPQPFTDKQIETLKCLAERSVLDVQLAELLTEAQKKDKALTESLEQQTATSEILRVISQSQTDVQPVFDTIAANARKLCEATFGSVLTFDGELIHLAAVEGYSPEWLEAANRTYPMLPSRGGATARAILTRAVVYLPDVRADPEYRLQTLAEAGGQRSALCVPMLHDGSPIGAITVTGAEPGMFTENQIAMLQTFADQAVIAIENTRLFNELQTRNRDLSESLEQQTATSEILRVISQSQRDVHPVFEAIAANARKLCRATTGSVNTFDGKLIHLAADDGHTPEGLEAIRQTHPRLPTASGASGRAILTRSAVYIPDVREDAKYPLQSIADTAGFRSVVAVPMLRESNPIGVISVTAAEPRMFSERQIAMLETFADQAVIAIENTRLFNELQTRNRDLTESLERQTATSDILRVISQSQRDVQPVFETIAANARRLCEAAFGAVYTFDGELIQHAAADGYSPEALEAVHRAYPMRPSRRCATARTILTRAVVYMPDIREDPEYDLGILANAV
jgi:GAF domain-containing protein